MNKEHLALVMAVNAEISAAGCAAIDPFEDRPCGWTRNAHEQYAKVLTAGKPDHEYSPPAWAVHLQQALDRDG